MPEIRSLTRPRAKEATVDVGEGDTLTIAFDANKVTPRWMADALDQIAEQDALSVCDALAAVLIDWDVTDDGQPFAPTRDNIALFSFPVVTALFEEVCTAAAPSSAEGNALSESVSESSSAFAPTPGTSPNGSDGSTSPALSASPSLR